LELEQCSAIRTTVFSDSKVGEGWKLVPGSVETQGDGKTVNGGRGVSVTQLRMQMAAPDDLVRQIVSDQRRGVSERSSLANEAETVAAKPKGTGWIEPRPLANPPGVEWVDRIAEGFAKREREGR